jgi:hypothetical protein
MRLLPRSSLGLVLALAAAWIVLITVLHVAVNRRAVLAPGAETRTVQVGGLPVT